MSSASISMVKARKEASRRRDSRLIACVGTFIGLNPVLLRLEDSKARAATRTRRYRAASGTFAARLPITRKLKGNAKPILVFMNVGSLLPAME
jgi:hypothetical protein